MTKLNISQVHTDQAPKAIGPYSQAIAAGNYLFVSGQIPLDAVTGKPVKGGIKEQTQKVIENLEAILFSRGLTLKNVVKTEVFIRNMNEFNEVNKIYANKFNHETQPARQVVEVSKLPLDVDIEISCIAYQNE